MNLTKVGRLPGTTTSTTTQPGDDTVDGDNVTDTDGVEADASESAASAARLLSSQEGLEQEVEAPRTLQVICNTFSIGGITWINADPLRWAEDGLGYNDNVPEDSSVISLKFWCDDEAVVDPPDGYFMPLLWLPVGTIPEASSLSSTTTLSPAEPGDVAEANETNISDIVWTTVTITTTSTLVLRSTTTTTTTFDETIQGAVQRAGQAGYWPCPICLYFDVEAGAWSADGLHVSAEWNLEDIGNFTEIPCLTERGAGSYAMVYILVPLGEAGPQGLSSSGATVTTTTTTTPPPSPPVAEDTSLSAAVIALIAVGGGAVLACLVAAIVVMACRQGLCWRLQVLMPGTKVHPEEDLEEDEEGTTPDACSSHGKTTTKGVDNSWDTNFVRRLFNFARRPGAASEVSSHAGGGGVGSMDDVSVGDGGDVWISELQVRHSIGSGSYIGFMDEESMQEVTTVRSNDPTTRSATRSANSSKQHADVLLAHVGASPRTQVGSHLHGDNDGDTSSLYTNPLRALGAAGLSMVPSIPESDSSAGRPRDDIPALNYRNPEPPEVRPTSWGGHAKVFRPNNARIPMPKSVPPLPPRPITSKPNNGLSNDIRIF